MRLHIVLRYVGFALLLNAIFLFLSSIISAINSDSAFFPLLYSAIIAALFGVFPLIFVPATSRISNNEGLMIVIFSWLLSCLIGVIPYILWGGEFTFTNAWFESVSGYTTTGSSILTNVEALPLGLLFWRSATHFIGGVGIIIFVLSILPHMGIAGMVLYRSEMSALALKNFHYRARTAVQILLIIYLGLIVLETIALQILGMNLFDAVAHAFATVATGGFSPKNTSIAFYQSTPIEIVIMIFMVLSGIHFALLFSVISGNFKNLWKNPIVRYYILVLCVGIIVVMINVHGKQFSDWLASLRYSAFQVISIGTSTGFANVDTSIWPSLAHTVLIFFTLQCACAGSTSGGIKVDRVFMLGKSFIMQLKQVRYPNAVIPVKIEDQNVNPSTLSMSITYIAVYLFIVFISTVLLTSLGMDSLSAFSGSAATMGNVGPGFGMVGSMSNFHNVPELGKWILTLTMLLGRLEIYGLVIFFIPKHWKK